jgi:hypothetical protein
MRKSALIAYGLALLVSPLMAFRPAKAGLLVTALAGTVALGTWVTPAKAAFIPASALFFTAPTDGILTFTYEGFSAGDTDHMIFTFNGDELSINQTTPVGTVAHEAVLAGQLYQLSLHNDQTGVTWSSNLASNSDGTFHLASTDTFSDFRLNVTAPTPVNTDCAIADRCYLGWEDLSGADGDFNDLVFALQFIPSGLRSAAADPIPEPTTLVLLCTGLLGVGLARRRGDLGADAQKSSKFLMP